MRYHHIAPVGPRCRLAATVAAMALAGAPIASCSSDDGDTSETTVATTTEAPGPTDDTLTDDTIAPPATTDASDDEEMGDGESVDDDGAHEPGAPVLAGLADVVEQHTATSGDGVRPLLAWSAVDGADHYGVYLYAPDESIYWAWQGTDTAVHVGGADQLPDAAAGPQVSPGMTWAVVAYDAGQLPIASSERRPIAP